MARRRWTVLTEESLEELRRALATKEDALRLMKWIDGKYRGRRDENIIYYIVDPEVKKKIRTELEPVKINKRAFGKSATNYKFTKMWRAQYEGATIVIGRRDDGMLFLRLIGQKPGRGVVFEDVLTEAFDYELMSAVAQAVAAHLRGVDPQQGSFFEDAVYETYRSIENSPRKWEKAFASVAKKLRDKYER